MEIEQCHQGLRAVIDPQSRERKLARSQESLETRAECTHLGGDSDELGRVPPKRYFVWILTVGARREKSCMQQAVDFVVPGNGTCLV